MKTVTASEFQKNFGNFKEIAQREPVVVTSNGRESVVLISTVEYAAYLKLRKDEKYVYGGKVTEDFKRDVSKFMENHKAVLEGLAK